MHTRGVEPKLPRRARPLLFDALPGLEANTPWRSLTHGPTGVERIDRTVSGLEGVEAWMKRDDLASPIYGGNKVRRYEFLLASAEARGCRRLVTAGGVASTQAMATALFGRALGFAVRMVLFDQPITRFAKQALLIDADAGAELIAGGNYLTTALRMVSALVRDRKDGNFLILPGAANPVANLGYVDAMLELAQQVEAGLLPRPDLIVLPTGSSGTLAALSLGAAWLGWDTEVVGVRITPWIATNRLTIGQIVRATDRHLHARDPARWRPQADRVRWSLEPRALGPGYGHPTAEARAAIDEVRALTGAPGEVTYSAKALVGLRLVAAEPRHRGKTILLWNTLSTMRPEPGPTARSKVPPSLQWVLDAPEVA